jgi:hypothetical protein
MKTTLTSISIALIIASSAQANISITNFGSASLNQTSSDFDTTTQTVSSLELIGTTENSYFADLFSPVDISSLLSPSMTLSLSGTFTGTIPPGQFGVELFDSGGNSNQYNGFINSFAPAGTPTTVSLALANNGGFTGTVSSIGFTAGPGGTDAVNYNLTNLSAVPEPSTYALMALGGLVLFFIARRRKAQV